MQAKEVIVIFDIGKTNKKMLVFDRQYQLCRDRMTRLEDTPDTDGFPSESVKSLCAFINDCLNEVEHDKEFDIKAINFSAYGASMVLLENDRPAGDTVYNYLKPYPDALAEKLYRENGGKELFAVETASPILGSLNSGLQLYRWKEEAPALFAGCTGALHLPQFLAWLVHGHSFSEITSIGCHTALWDFKKWDYHSWVQKAGITRLLAPLHRAENPIAVNRNGRSVWVGTGLHDSSAALIPYLKQCKEPFALLSTGTWCITLNPFNDTALEAEELAQDVLCYISHEGKPIKASRVHGGAWHEDIVKRIGDHFHCAAHWEEKVAFDPHIAADGEEEKAMDAFPSAQSAYHHYMRSFVKKQVHAIRLVTFNTPVKQLLIDGGFSRNQVFLQLLKRALPELQLFVATVAQGSSLGAALVLHSSWNTTPYPENLVQVQSIDRLYS